MKHLLPCLVLASLGSAQAQQPKLAQNPSPMVETTRSHLRLKEERPPGQRIPLKIGTLFVPEKLDAKRSSLFIHFHGDTWIPEIAAAKNSAAVIAVQLGAGSSVYA